MKTGDKQLCPTNTAMLVRQAIYQPTQRPTMRTGEWVQTGHGRCRVHGRLGQRHEDLMEAIMKVAERRRDTDDGGIELLVDPAKVRKTLSDSRYSNQRLWVLVRELMQAVIEIESPNYRAQGHLIDHIVESPATRRNPLDGGVRHLWRVRVGGLYVRLIAHDLNLYYDPAPIARLGSGISQAVARYVLSHKGQPNGGWKLDGLIEIVEGREIGGTAIRNRRRALRKDADRLRELGIVIDGDRVLKAESV